MKNRVREQARAMAEKEARKYPGQMVNVTLTEKAEGIWFDVKCPSRD